MSELRLPSLGADMERGTVLEWRVAPGDEVHKGDIVAVIDTEKSDIEVETWDDGVVAELLVEVGTEIPVGTPILRWADGEGAAAERTEPEAAEPEAEAGAPAEAVEAPPAEEPVAGEQRAEPAVAAPPAARPTRPAPERVPAVAVGADGAARVRSSPYARHLAAELGVELPVSGSGPDGAVVAADVLAAARDTGSGSAPTEAPAAPAAAAEAP